MITSTIRTEQAARPSPRVAFTLVEVMVGMTLGCVVLSGVLSSFLMIGRSGVSAINYSAAEAEIRRGIEEFSRDVRMARNMKWNSATSITLTVPDNYATSGNLVTYAYDGGQTGPTARSFYRMPGNASSTADKTIFVRNISSFSFARFNRLNRSAVSDAETKRVQLTLNVKRSRSTLVDANTSVVSASFMLRNKSAN